MSKRVKDNESLIQRELTKLVVLYTHSILSAAEEGRRRWLLPTHDSETEILLRDNTKFFLRNQKYKSFLTFFRKLFSWEFMKHYEV